MSKNNENTTDFFFRDVALSFPVSAGREGPFLTLVRKQCTFSIRILNHGLFLLTIAFGGFLRLSNTLYAQNRNVPRHFLDFLVYVLRIP